MLKGMFKTKATNDICSIHVLYEGHKQEFAIYNGMKVEELDNLLRNFFQLSNPPLGFQREDSLVIPLSLACLHPQVLARTVCTLLVNETEVIVQRPESFRVDVSGVSKRQSSRSPTARNLEKKSKKKYSFDEDSCLFEDAVTCGSNNNSTSSVTQTSHSNASVSDHLLKIRSIHSVSTVDAHSSGDSFLRSSSDSHVTYGSSSDFSVSRSPYSRDDSVVPSYEIKVSLSRDEQEELKKNINSHIQLLYHVVSCYDDNCVYENCFTYKELFRHEKACKVTIHNGCEDCLKLTNILSVHARKCKDNICTIPHCREYRQHYISCYLCTERLRSVLKSKEMDEKSHALLNEMYCCLCSGNN